MGSKRPFSAVSASEPQVSDRPGGAKKKRVMAKTPKVKGESINWVKKRARTLERLLSRATDNIPADKQREMERELAAHRKRIQENEHGRERSNMIKKYHMVRFFERQKAERLQKQLRKRLGAATDPEEIAQINADIHISDVDYHYTVYFPYMEKYVSLYPISAKKETTSEEKAAAAARALRAPRPQLWSIIEKAMEEGKEALEMLRDRVLDVDGRSEPAPRQFSEGKAPKARKARHGDASDKTSAKRDRAKQAFSSTGQAKPTRNAPRPQDLDSDSDGGGFFEEDCHKL
ncbi:hypothetical protein NKR23_g2347 [Pleurostoma richardsiae]|uniref:rRNA-processing protein EFG1 n=1 Tax=Pleurostoma richardsiae TaxID=41990 RepID=A0AA38S272_9PEZI|nr:hypothetical protein NKR23_g2347 [Pleurostoma richardsiae]